MFNDGIIKFERSDETIAKIVVVGIGGGGGNAVNRMIESDLGGVEYVAINTDKQDLAKSNADTKIQIGDKTTGGLGAGGNPEKGQASAEENLQEIENAIKGSDMVFITAGMGGGTGTGAAPIVAKLSRELGILTVGVVTKPFSFEGRKRRDNAELGVNYLGKYVDSLVIVPNDKLLLISDEKTTIETALSMANEVLKQGVQGITDLIYKPGLINLDFADVQTVMSNRGLAHMGIGRASGDKRVSDAVRSAIESPLLETTSTGARAVLLNISGGYNLTMFEVNSAAEQIEQAADRDAVVIFGTSVNEELGDEIIVTVIATGFEERPGDEVHVPDKNVSDSSKDFVKRDTLFASDVEEDDEDNFGGYESLNDSKIKDTKAKDGKEPRQENIFGDEVEEGGPNDFVIPQFLTRD